MKEVIQVTKERLESNRQSSGEFHESLVGQIKDNNQLILLHRKDTNRLMDELEAKIDSLHVLNDTTRELRQELGGESAQIEQLRAATQRHNEALETVESLIREVNNHTEPIIVLIHLAHSF